MDLSYAGTRRCDGSLFSFLPPYIPQGGLWVHYVFFPHPGKNIQGELHPPDQTSGSKPKLIMQKEYLTTLMGNTMWFFARK